MGLTDAAEIVVEVDEWLDSDLPLIYKNNDLAQHWARVSKLIEEVGEAVEAFIGATGQNPRKGFHKTQDEVIDELADVAMTAVPAIQHFTKDPARTEEILWDKLVSLHERVPERYRRP